MNKCPNCGASTNEETCMLCGTIIPKKIEVEEVVEEQPVRISVIPLNENEAILTEKVNPVENIVVNNIEQNENKVLNKNSIDVLINKELEKEDPQKINTSVSDELLIDAYIKKHQKSLKKGFSICTLLFNAIYILYRKMYLLGFTVIIFNILIYLFTKDMPYYLMYILLSVLDIVLALTFKKMYLRHVKGKVEFAKLEFPNAREDELLKVCKIKGGTSIKTPVVTFIIIFLGAIGIAILNTFGVFNDLKDDLQNKRVTISEMSFKLPSMLKEINNIGSIAYYETPKYNEKDYIIGNRCRLSVSIHDSDIVEKWYKNSARKYLEEELENQERNNKKNYDKYYNVGKIKEKYIGDDLWLHSTIDADSEIEGLKFTTYYYATIHNDKLYAFNFDIHENENNHCFDAYNKILNSITFK